MFHVSNNTVLFLFTVIAPKFDELSDKYPDAIFLKVRKNSLLTTNLLLSL